MVDQLEAVGIERSKVDLWTAVLAGLVAQQLSNDPVGDRWSVLLDGAVDMLIAELVPRLGTSHGPKEHVMTTIDVSTIAPLTHDAAMRLQAAELERTLTLLRGLEAAQWQTQTDCPAWDVRAMYQHVLGACEAGASMRENVHQLRAGYAYRKAHGGPLEAALSNVQVRERSDLTGPQIVERLEAVAPRTVRGRRRIPGLVRNHAKLKIDGPVQETWNLGYLIDTIYLRDLWMHRVDAAHALGQPLELSADHDGRIVEDVVAEWSRRHGRPFMMDLTGPAGGSYAHRPDAAEVEHLSLDAVEFCRTLAGRAPAAGLLAVVVPF